MLVNNQFMFDLLFYTGTFFKKKYGNFQNFVLLIKTKARMSKGLEISPKYWQKKENKTKKNFSLIGCAKNA